jgi:glycosyltransferase involved in cell wall biosynthesis
VRILLTAARQRGIGLHEIHADIWHGIEDKSRISGFWRRTAYLLRWLAAYPALVLRYLRCPAHDLVFIPYMGHLDVIVIRPFARLRNARVVWDALLSLHGTVVEDRALVAADSLAARALIGIDRLSFACADHLLTGTRARAEQYSEVYRVPVERITPILLATELQYFQPGGATDPAHPERKRPSILFYGQFSPLHGLDTVLEVADSDSGRRWDWVFIGTGQEGWRIGEWLSRDTPAHVRWLEWVPYEELASWIHDADLCLGLFGTSRKAATSLANKIFQILACARPLVTADTPAIRELLPPGTPGVYLVPAGNAPALAGLLDQLITDPAGLRTRVPPATLLSRLSPEALGRELARAFDQASFGTT